MYLHLGGDYAVNFKNIVAICDLDNTTVSSITRDYLKRAQTDGKIIEVSDELPKAFVVCEYRGEKTVYLTPISAATLNKRARFFRKEEWLH